MNVIIGIYSNDAIEAQEKIAQAIQDGYKQPILFTKDVKCHTDYTRQYNIIEVSDEEHARQINTRKFGNRADFYGTIKDLKSAGPALESEYDIDVAIAYYRNLYLVSQTIDSILWQQEVKPLIHLVNDCSREDDSALKQRYGHLKNIRWYKTSKNVGPYAIVNNIAQRAQTEFLSVVDSDDVYLPNHLISAINGLKDADVWCSYMMQFLNPLQEHHERNINAVKKAPIIKSGIVLKSCRSPRVINATMVIKTDIFKALNGFNGDFFCGGDTEFTQRLQITSTINPKICFHKEVTAMRRMCTNSLSNSQDRFGFQSAERKAVLEETNRRFDEWEKLKIIDPTKYGNLDRQEDYLIPVTVNNRRNSKVYACMATIPRRIYALEKAVKSLLPQVDQLFIHLNDFNFVPEFLKHSKIQLVFGDNSQMSCTKFLWGDKLNGYILTCDDDFIYPDSYVEQMIEGINRYKCWCCFHGSKLHELPIENYYKDRIVYDGKRGFDKDTYIDVPGTGLSGFHTDDIQVSIDDINLPGMEDIAAYLHTYNHSYKVIALQHGKNWLKGATHTNDKGLWGEARLDGSKETEKINRTRTYNV